MPNIDIDASNSYLSEIEYIAKPPKTKKQKRLKLLSRAFPPTALWRLLKFIANKIAGEAIGNHILPSHTDTPAGIEFKNESDRRFRAFQFESKKIPNLACKKTLVRTYDNAYLATLEITPNQLQKNQKERMHIIYFVGRESTYERNLDAMLADAITLNANVIGFNYRRNQENTDKVKSAKNSRIDGISQVQRLLNRGVPPEKIILRGTSYGALVATAVGKHFHNYYRRRNSHQDLNVFSVRSPASIAKTVTGWIRSGYPDGKETGFTRFLAAIAEPFIKAILVLTKWEFSTVKDFSCLPPERKGYLVVRTPRKLIPPNAKRVPVDDPVISTYASLHTGLKAERQQHKIALLEAKAALLFQTANTQAELARHKESLAKIQATEHQMRALKFYSTDVNANCHCTPLAKLKNRYGATGQEFFHQFVRKVEQFNNDCDAKKLRR